MKLYDISLTLSPESIRWVTAQRLELIGRKRMSKGDTNNSSSIHTSVHAGTHVDAPLHFWKDGAAVDAIPLERLIAPAVLVDVTAQVQRDRDYRVAVDDLRAWEAANGRIPAGAIVLLRTGFGTRWPERAAYLGTDERGPGAVAHLHFPGLGAAAAAWLADERKIGAVGLDTASIDHGPSQSFETHVALFRRGVPAFENVANLDKLPVKGFTVVALPMKIRGGSGGPLRIVAILGH